MKPELLFPLIALALVSIQSGASAAADDYVKTPYYAEIKLVQLRSPCDRRPNGKVNFEKRWSDGAGHLRVETNDLPEALPSLYIYDFGAGVCYQIDKRTKTIKEVDAYPDFFELASSYRPPMKNMGIRQQGKNEFVHSEGSCCQTTYSIDPATGFVAKFERLSNAFTGDPRGTTVKLVKGPQPAERFRLPDGYTRISRRVQAKVK